MRFVSGVVLGSSIFVGVLAAPPSRAEDVKRACVDASTQGQTLRQDEKLVEAREQMLVCAREVCPAIVRSHCAKWLREIEDQTPSVVVRAQDGDGSDLTEGRLTIDGQPSKLDGHAVSLDPGEHVLVVEKADGARKEEKVLLADGEKSRLLVLRFPRPPGAPEGGGSGAGPAPEPEARPAIPVGAWVLGAVSVASFGAFAYFGLTAQSDLDALKSTCSPACSDDATRPGRTKALIADVALGVGIASLGGAVLWTILSHTGGSAKSTAVRVDVAPVAGGGVAGVSGAF